MNIMLVHLAKELFIGFVGTIGKKKTKHYMSTKIKKYIVVVDPCKMIQICYDNPSSMVGAMKAIVRAYPHIYRPSSYAYILDLIIEDWVKKERLKQHVYNSKTIVKYVMKYVSNHHLPMALFKNIHQKFLCLIHQQLTLLAILL